MSISALSFFSECALVSMIMPLRCYAYAKNNHSRNEVCQTYVVLHCWDWDERMDEMHLSVFHSVSNCTRGKRSSHFWVNYPFKSLGYICSNSQKSTEWVKMIKNVMPKIIKILSKDHVP